jgi:hypothetical protein
MLQRRAPAAGLIVHVGNHSFRATGITAYLNAGGTLENAQAMAAHESPRTTKLYDRTGDKITLDEVERIAISVCRQRCRCRRRNSGPFFRLPVPTSLHWLLSSLSQIASPLRVISYLNTAHPPTAPSSILTL